jgi:hypothetical protein
MRQLNALLLIFIVAGVLAACATSPESDELRLPPHMQATCEQEGGCGLITRAKLEALLMRAMVEGAKSCKSGVRL